ncbi:hypothetical protein V2J09_017671 [Rumex salicifolius]
MEIDPNESGSKIIKQKSEALQSLATGSLSTSIACLSGSARGIPSDKDFHFYYLFDEFRAAIDEIAASSNAMLEKIGSAEQLWGSGSGKAFPGEDIDDNTAYNWLVSFNDEILERLDVSLEEALSLRKEQEQGGGKKAAVVDEDGFQLVCGKKKKAAMLNHGGDAEMKDSSVRVVEKDKKVATAKPKVPFHIPTIRRPQDEFNILVNNANKPFEHVWLQRSEDGSRCIHPLEKVSVNDFVECKAFEPQKPTPLENTPFKLVETVKDLKEMCAKLRNVDEIAVDLEHNQYRSFQGLTCLMQISTRTEDFIVDTLKLRIHIGPHLREIFKDHSKKKVMHGADRDIAWLQRDFGIYICNLFDTGQASRVLKMERNSLEYLLHHFCEVMAKKEYQNADWRLRPLPLEMIRYAREDTHYLLYIYDLMRARLVSESTEENSDDLLLQVYQRSYDVCMQLYEKELLTETSYLHIYGLQAANFNAQQLAIVSGLYEWRDVVARAEDESTGYILPNKALLEIAKQMPVTTGKLKRLVRFKYPYIEKNLSSVVNIIRHSTQHSSAFEAVVKQLAETRSEVVRPESELQLCYNAKLCISKPFSYIIDIAHVPPLVSEKSVAVPDSSMAEQVKDKSDLVNETGKAEVGASSVNLSPNVCLHDNEPNNGSVNETRKSHAVEKHACGPVSEKATGATVQILKRPSRAFGALLGSLSSKKKVDPSRKDKELSKLEQIKSSVLLPFHSFVGNDDTMKDSAKMLSEAMVAGPSEEINEMPAECTMEDVIPLAGTSNGEESLVNSESAASEGAETEDYPEKQESSGGQDDEDELPSLSNLSCRLNKCLESSDQDNSLGKLEAPTGLQFKPFDYEEARKTIRFGEPGTKSRKADANGEGGGKSGSNSKRRAGGEANQQQRDQEALPQGRRRHAFPASGNRSATFL